MSSNLKFDIRVAARGDAVATIGNACRQRLDNENVAFDTILTRWGGAARIGSGGGLGVSGQSGDW